MSKYSEQIVDINNENNSLTKLIKLVPEKSEVLDFGCSSGYLGEYLIKNKNCEVIGLEIDKDDAKIAKERGYKDVIVCDLDTDDWENDLTGQKFDIAVFPDILEHLKYPEKTIEKAKKLLKTGGRMLVSIPNIAHLSIRLELLNGGFEYEEFGILDNTHLKHWTKDSFLRMVNKLGLYAEEINMVEMDIPKEIFEKFIKDIKIENEDFLNQPDNRAFQWIFNLGQDEKKDVKQPFLKQKPLHESQKIIKFNENQIRLLEENKKTMEDDLEEMTEKIKIIGENFKKNEEDLNSCKSIMESRRIEVQKLQNELNYIKNSLSWRLLKFLKIPYKIFIWVIKKSRKSVNIIRKYGWKLFLKEVRKYFIKLCKKEKKYYSEIKNFLFISGCHFEAPDRYRCKYQKEQLECHGLTGDHVFYTNINENLVNQYDIFIFYRIPITDDVKKMIKKAREQNKLCIFDIDDLVFAREYVKDLDVLKSMSQPNLDLYYNGIDSMNETVKLFDYATCSTEGIARELKKYIPNVYVNRNSVSKELLQISDKSFHKKSNQRKDNNVVIGYFSGSNTHNADFRMIEEAVLKILEKYSHTKLLIAGVLELSPAFEKFVGRIIKKDFVRAYELPDLIMETDINLAPLEDSVFNNAKSEIKFTEAALLRKATIASDLEAFRHAIIMGKTGLLAKTGKDWFDAMELLVTNEKKRIKMGKMAYNDVIKRYKTETIGKGFLQFIKKNQAQKITYLSPSTKLSGGVYVLCEHAQRLQRRGYNTSIISFDNRDRFEWFLNFTITTIPANRLTNSTVDQNILISTLWTTVYEAKKIKAKKKFYFVQNKEYEFYPHETVNYKMAKKTYKCNDMKFFTMSKCVQKLLKKEFNQSSKYVPNGLNLDWFFPGKKTVSERKLRVLIEGDPDCDYKNTDEAFKITDKENCEVWFVSYGGAAKPWYKPNKEFNKIPIHEMRNLYIQCDVLLKTSKLESFAYPPLEMMACGGVSLVSDIDGIPYIKNGENALRYKLGDIEDGKRQLRRLIEDRSLMEKLRKNGLKTAKKYNWENSIDQLEKVLGVSHKKSDRQKMKSI